MAKFDSEDLLDMVLEVMINGDALNNKIAAVDAEKIAAGKALDPVMAPIKEYFRQSWTDKILNATPGIFYGIEEVLAVSNAGVAAKTYKVFIEVVMVDSGMTNDSSNRLARYTRALEELFQENFKPAIAVGTFELTELQPMAMKLALDSSEEIKTSGVAIKISIV